MAIRSSSSSPPAGPPRLIPSHGCRATQQSVLPPVTPARLGLRFQGLEPSPLPESIDFALRRRDEPERFNAILFTDPQPESLAEIGYIRDDVVAGTAGVDAAFGITHGGVMFDDLAHYERYNRI